MTEPTLADLLAEMQGLAARVSGIESVVRERANTVQLTGPQIVADQNPTEFAGDLFAALSRAGIKVETEATQPASLRDQWAQAAQQVPPPVPQPVHQPVQQSAVGGMDDAFGPLIRRIPLPHGEVLIWQRHDEGTFGAFNLRLQKINGDVIVLREA